VRVASRIIGVALALAGLVFLGLSVSLLLARPDSVLEDPELGRRALSELPFVVVGVGFLLAGWYFLRLDVDQIDDAQDRPASRFAPFLLAHRGALRIIALVGLAISVIRLVAVYFGYPWPAWPLILAWIGLLVIGRQIAKPSMMSLDWQSVPELLRPVLKATVNVGRAMVMILLAVFAWSQWSHRVPAQLVQAGLITLVFAWEFLFFAYGEVRSVSV
jgi:hypothetical protein